MRIRNEARDTMNGFTEGSGEASGGIIPCCYSKHRVIAKETIRESNGRENCCKEDYWSERISRRREPAYHLKRIVMLRVPVICEYQRVRE